jgi:hypothetical protein
VAYNRIRGQYASALEHATPERFFVDTTTCNLPTATPTSTPAFDPAKPACAEGISAVKALAVAQSQGQKVFTVTSQNVAAVLPQLTGHSAQTKADVQNAVNAGKEVTISQAKITYSGWTGAGYTIVDPTTGAGSYLIEGGANGGWLEFVGAVGLELSKLLMGIVLTGMVASVIASFGGAYFVAVAAALAVSTPFILAIVALGLLSLLLVEYYAEFQDPAYDGYKTLASGLAFLPSFGAHVQREHSCTDPFSGGWICWWRPL